MRTERTAHGIAVSIPITEAFINSEEVTTTMDADAFEVFLYNAVDQMNRDGTFYVVEKLNLDEMAIRMLDRVKGA